MSVTFEDETTFNVTLQPAFTLTGNLTREADGESRVLVSYEATVQGP